MSGTSLPRRVARRLRDELRRGARVPREAYHLARGHRLPFLKPYWFAEELAAGAAHHDDAATERVGRVLLDAASLQGVAVATSSGRTAMRVALRALMRSRPERDEVVIPTYACRGLLDPVLECGLTPVFTDVGDDLNMTAETVAPAVSARTLAVVIVHLGGQRVRDADEIARRAQALGAVPIEDLCQAYGGGVEATAWGAATPLAFYSFGLGKNLMATAGGLLVARAEIEAVEAEARRLEREAPDSAEARFAYVLRAYQRDGVRALGAAPAVPRAAFTESYRSCRMAPLDAALLACQAPRLREVLAARARNAGRLLEGLADVGGLTVPGRDGPHVWTKFTVLADTPARAAGVRRRLAAAGIETEPMYTPLHLRVPSPRRGAFPVAESVAPRAFNLPVRPSLGPEHMAYVADAVRRAVGGGARARRR